MTFKAEQGKADWEKGLSVNTNPYGRGVYDYAEKWADLMEKGISDGKQLPDIAGALSHEADTDGITGFMYGCAVNILAHVWVHGETLRKWHNGKYGYSGEGTINPAILTIKR